jgi:HSP20 family protein
MALWNWDPFRELEALRREIDGAMRGRGNGPASRAAFLPGRAARMYPMINLSEDKDAYYVEALAPGVEPESLEVTVVHNALTISGEKKPLGDVDPQAYHRNERATGRFVRSIDLPSEVDSEKVKADYSNGLLLITMPKAETAKPKQINVSVA